MSTIHLYANREKQNSFPFLIGYGGATFIYKQEPIWSVQLPYSVCETVFLQVGLFLD